MIWDKIKGLKIWNSINTGFSNNKSPKNPKNTNIPIFTQDHKDIKKSFRYETKTTKITKW